VRRFAHRRELYQTWGNMFLYLHEQRPESGVRFDLALTEVATETTISSWLKLAAPRGGHPPEPFAPTGET